MDYASRNRIIASMGYADYEAYLQSPLWKSIRGRVYAAKGKVCLRCKTERANQIHHTQYDTATMRGDTLNHLVPICGDCHQAEHGLIPRKNVGKVAIVIPWDGQVHRAGRLSAGGSRGKVSRSKAPRTKPIKSKAPRKAGSNEVASGWCKCGRAAGKLGMCKLCRQRMGARRYALERAAPIPSTGGAYQCVKCGRVTPAGLKCLDCFPLREIASPPTPKPAPKPSPAPKSSPPINVCKCGNSAGKKNTVCARCRRGDPPFERKKKATKQVTAQQPKRKRKPRRNLPVEVHSSLASHVRRRRLLITS